MMEGSQERSFTTEARCKNSAGAPGPQTPNAGELSAFPLPCTPTFSAEGFNPADLPIFRLICFQWKKQDPRKLFGPFRCPGSAGWDLRLEVEAAVLRNVHEEKNGLGAGRGNWAVT